MPSPAFKHGCVMHSQIGTVDLILQESTKIHQTLAKHNERDMWQFYKDDSKAAANMVIAPRPLPATHNEHLIFLATQFALLQHRKVDTVINLIKHSELMM